jgi:Bacterial Ig-like domain (group 3)
MCLAPRNRPFLLVLCLVGLGLGPLAVTGIGTASAAAPAVKARITTKSCTSASCLITLTVTGTMFVTPTGTVRFALGSAAVTATGGGSCSDDPMVATTGSSASATCDASDLPVGRHKVTAWYSGDDFVDPTNATRAVKVKGASSG